MRSKLICAFVSAFMVYAAVTFGGIPEPDVVLYGPVRIDGWLQGADDTDVVVAAKVGEKTVGRYTMGDNLQTGDQYVLRIRLEWPVPESPLSDDAATRADGGDHVQILVQDGANDPVQAATLHIDRFGIIQSMLLRIGTEPDADGDSDADLRDVAIFQRCFTGGTPCVPECSPECAALDHDTDDDVDLVDLKDFAPRVSGPR